DRDLHAVDAGTRAGAAGDRGDAGVHGQSVPAGGDPREDGGRGRPRQTPGAAHRAQANRERSLIGRHVMARTSWFDDNAQHPSIHERMEKLESFTSALADGQVSKQELSAQEARLMTALKAV